MSQSPVEKLIFNVQGLVVELKQAYFSKNEPLTDDEILIHKLCVRLENVLRYGAREKYSFLGVRKDYWNYISECVPKDESVIFVQSTPDFKTNQGKGRAFLRQALIQKSLADTLQRCIINARATKDYYGNNAVFRNEALLNSLIHSLYDLNAVDFSLPYQGYDLDKSFPAFARKNFNVGSRSRRSSITSMSSIQSFLPDPLQNLRVNVALIESVVNAWQGKAVDNCDSNSDVSLLQLLDKLVSLRENIISIKSRCDDDVEVLRRKLENLEEEKKKYEADSEERMKLIHERYKSMYDIGNSAANDKIKDLTEQLVYTQEELSQLKLSCATTSPVDVQEEYKTLTSENKDLTETLESLTVELANVKDGNHSSISTNKILEDKLSELRKMNDTLRCSEKGLLEKNQLLESSISLKDAELNIIRRTLEKSTGYVVGSFEDLKSELHSHQEKTCKALHDVRSTNEAFLSDSKSLATTNSELSFRIQVLEEKVLQETSKKEEVERILSDLKSKYTEDMRHHADLQNFIEDICIAANEVLDNDAVMIGKCDKDTALQKLSELQLQVKEWNKEKGMAEEEVKAAKNELAQVSELLGEAQKRSQDADNERTSIMEAKKRSEELQTENMKLNEDIEKYNSSIYDMSVDLINLKGRLAMKEEDCDSMKNTISALKIEVASMKEEKEDHLKTIETVSSELGAFKEELNDLIAERDYLSQQIEISGEQEKALISKIDHLETNLENNKKVAAQEVESLKFQLSIEEMKKDTALKDLADATVEKDVALSDLAILMEKHRDLESKHRSKSDLWELEREQLTSQCKDLNQQYDEVKKKYDVAESDISFLKVEIGKMRVKKQEDKILLENASNEISSLLEDKSNMEENYKSSIEFLTQDLEDVKGALVNTTKDKLDLWQKKEELERDIKERFGDRWVTDKQVSRCTSCQEVFTLTRRKHHCRLCGCIFCHDCSNRWIKSSQSKKRMRACNSCADANEELKENNEKDLNQSNVNMDVSDRSFFSDEESLEDEKKVDEIISEEKVDESLCNEQITTGPYEILTSEECVNTGSFGSSQEIQISNIDQLQASLIPAVDSDSNLSFEKIIVDIPAGVRSILPVVIVGPELNLSWEFTSSPKDVGFGVAFKTMEEESMAKVETLIPLSRYISHKLTIHGKMKVLTPGIYYLVFDNSYSRLTTKTVECTVGLRKSAVS